MTMCSIKKTPLVISLLFIALQLASSQSKESFISLMQRIRTVEAPKRSAIVDSFMTAQKSNGFPVTTDTIAYFVYRGKVASAIEVTGDHTQWSPNGDTMVNVPATDMYYCARKFEPDARIDYKFVKDGDWILDPLNTHIVKSGFGQNSELAMPLYVQPALICFDSSDTARNDLFFYFHKQLYPRCPKDLSLSSAALRFNIVPLS